MDKGLRTSLRVTAIVMMACSASGAGFSWVYMEWWEALMLNIVSLFTIIMWIRLWIRLERMFKQLTRLQAEIDRIFLEIMNQLSLR
jgi:hypothetical protein